MFSLRTHAWITGGLFAAIIVIAAVGGVLHDWRILADGSGMQHATRVLFFALTLALFLSAVPLMVKLVLGPQVRFGNAGSAPVRALIARERTIILAIWGLALAGLVVALPAAIQDGFFDDTGDAASRLAAEIAAMPSQGTLVTRPGMPVADMVRRSSLKLNIGKVVIAGGAVFTFEITDTAISVPRSRYYYINYARGDHTRVGTMSIGTASRTMTLSELDAADVTLGERLAADGWQAGREVFRTEQDRTLHGGRTEGPYGTMWLKGDTVLNINRRRMDDRKPDEPLGAGNWIQFVELDVRAEWPWFERFEFAPARPRR